MAHEPKGGLIGLLVAKVVCCGGLVLVATGALSGVGTWLLDGGLLWLAAGAVVLIAGIALRLRRKTRNDTANDRRAGWRTPERIG